MAIDYLKMAAMYWWRVEDIMDALFEDSLTKQKIINCQLDKAFNKKSRSSKHKKYLLYEDILRRMTESILYDPIFRQTGAYEIDSLRHNKENSAEWQLGPRTTIEILESKIIPYMKAKWVEPSRGMAALIQALKENHPITPSKKNKIKSKSQRHKLSRMEREKVRETAKQLWEEDKTLTIAGLIISDAINKAAPNRAETTLRSWVKDLAPSNKPGRRPKKN